MLLIGLIRKQAAVVPPRAWLMVPLLEEGENVVLAASELGHPRIRLIFQRKQAASTLLISPQSLSIKWKERRKQMLLSKS